jgi:heavy metal-binding protein
MRTVTLILWLGLSLGVFASTAATMQQATLYMCSMHPEVQSSKAGKCPKCLMELVVQSKPDSPAPAPGQKGNVPVPPSTTGDSYTCSMHPDVRATAPGNCPRCGMTLVPIIPAISDDFDLSVECSPPTPKPNEKLRLRFSVFNPKSGQQARDFQIMHDQLFHLFVVSQDLNEFQHIHPEFNPDGSFSIETVLPQAGRYKLYADVYPSDGGPQVSQTSIVTAGYKSDLFASKPRLVPDTNLVRTIDGMKIELKITPEEIISGQPVTLKYHLTESATGLPVRDLRPYLAAWGHTLILSDDQSDYVHSHPEELVPEAANKSELRGGPDVTFGAFLPHPGLYKMWTQFLRGNTLTTVSFIIKAKRLG